MSEFHKAEMNRQKDIVLELHGRAQAAELERDAAARELEQLRRDNQVLLERIEQMRARREVELRALEDLQRACVEGAGIKAMIAGGDLYLTALEEAERVLTDAKQRGGGR